MGSPFGPFWSAKYLNFGGESCETRILSRSIQETYTSRNVKNNLNNLRAISWSKNMTFLTKKAVIKENFAHNHVHNTLRLFDS